MWVGRKMLLKLKISMFVILMALCLVGCGDDEKKTRAWSFFPNMHEQESLRAQEPEHGKAGKRTGRGMRSPIEGTIPTHFTKYKVAKGAMESENTKNPLPSSIEILKAGRRAYNIYCMVCHGERGDGDGNIIPKNDDSGKLYSGYSPKSAKHFIQPPELHSQRVFEMKDGELFNYITHGGSMMPKYNHLPIEMRWSIIHYLRVLFKANHATKAELEAYKKDKENLKDPSAKDIIHNWRNK
jgi:mono/diheme cytochrome c family protein